MIRKGEKTVLRWKSSLIVNFMISIIVRCLSEIAIKMLFCNELSIISRTNEREALSQCEGFLNKQIGMKEKRQRW